MYVVNLNLVSDWTDISIENTCGGVHIDPTIYTLHKVFENFHNIINRTCDAANINLDKYLFHLEMYGSMEEFICTVF